MKSLVLLTLFFVVLTADSSAQMAQIPLAEMPGASALPVKPQVKFAQLENGITLEYAEQGDLSGIPVIFLHGFSDSWRSFELNLPFLPSTIHAFSLSQRGHGNSDKPKQGYTTKDFADDVAAFMDKMRLKKAIIVGHSMGSSNARQFALSYPDRTMGLVLIGSLASFKNNSSIAELEGLVNKLEEPVDSDFIHAFQRSTIIRPIPDEYYVTIVRESQKLPVYVWQEVTHGWKDANLAERLSHLRIPILLLWGEKDNFAPQADQFLLNNSFRNSTLEIYRGTGHALHWEEPQRFANDLIGFANSMKK